MGPQANSCEDTPTHEPTTSPLDPPTAATSEHPADSPLDMGPQANSQIRLPAPESTLTAKTRGIQRPRPIPESNGALHSDMWNHIFQMHKKRNIFQC